MKRSISVVFLLLCTISSKMYGDAVRGSFESQMIFQKINNNSAYISPQQQNSLPSANTVEKLRFIFNKNIFECGNNNKLISCYIKPYVQYQSALSRQDEKYLTLRFDECYIDYESGQTLYFLAGKKRVNWGVGFFFNPVDAINPLKDVFDPVHSEEGSHVVLSEFNYSNIALQILYSKQIEGFLESKYNRFGCRLGLMLNPVELKFYGFGGEEVKNMLGVSLRTIAGNFVLYSEGACAHGSDRIYFDENLSSFKKNDYIFSCLAGISYLSPSNCSMSIEYYFDGKAYSSIERKNYLNVLKQLPSSPVFNDALSQSDKNLSQHYAGYSFSVSQWHCVWDFEARGLCSVEQYSVFFVEAVQYRMTDLATLRLETQNYAGPADSEYGNFIFNNVVKLYLIINF